MNITQESVKKAAFLFTTLAIIKNVENGDLSIPAGVASSYLFSPAYDVLRSSVSVLGNLIKTKDTVKTIEFAQGEFKKLANFENAYAMLCLAYSQYSDTMSNEYFLSTNILSLATTAFELGTNKELLCSENLQKLGVPSSVTTILNNPKLLISNSNKIANEPKI